MVVGGGGWWWLVVVVRSAVVIIDVGTAFGKAHTPLRLGSDS